MASLAMILAFLAALAWLPPLAVLGWYGAASAATFAAYAYDKAAAREGRPRIAERTLHACSLAGGWPGAAAAQQLLRHKTRKPAFRALFLITAMANCALLATALLADRAALWRAVADIVQAMSG